jgi:hypothetical protein
MKKNLLIIIYLFFNVCFLCLGQPSIQSAISTEKRIALVIGNGNYISSTLANPENDARSMSYALRKLGFDVYNFENLDQNQMKRAIDDFGSKLKGYNVGLFYYAGHGIQSKGNNYLIPIDAELKTEEQVEYDCIRADRVLSLMETSGTKINILILDACRNNPFERSWTRSGEGRGLLSMNAPKGTLIAYATAPGSTASDGSGNNGLYTSAILESIQIPNLSIIQVFQKVRSIVAQRSQNKQIPWESTSLTGDFYFNASSPYLSNNTQNNSETNIIKSNFQVGSAVRLSTVSTAISLQKDYSWTKNIIKASVKSFIQKDYTVIEKKGVEQPDHLLNKIEVKFSNDGLMTEELIYSFVFNKKGKIKYTKYPLLNSKKYFHLDGTNIKVNTSYGGAILNYGINFINDTIIEDNENNKIERYLIQKMQIQKKYFSGWSGSQADLQDNNGTLTEIWEYNDKGLVSKIQGASSGLPTWMTYDYLEFDEHGNWTKAITNKSSGEKRISVREYFY